MRILITGGAGYIGSHLVVEMMSNGHEVLAVDNFANSVPESIDLITGLAGREVSFSKTDITDGRAIRRLCEAFRPDAVFHLAGVKSVSESALKPLHYHEINVFGSIQLLKAMDSVDCKHLVFSSSATVYGTPEYLPFDEEHRLAPVNPYGNSKLAVERIIRDWAQTDRAKSGILLRYFNPVGAHKSGDIGENPKGVPDNLMPYIGQVALGLRDKLVIFGNDYDTADGTGLRDYIHITDLVAGHLAGLDYAIENSGLQAVNLGSGSGHTVLQMVAAFERASGREIPYEFGPRRKGDLAAFYADASKAKSLFGWETQFGIDEMCRDAWRWQQRNIESL